MNLAGIKVKRQRYLISKEEIKEGAKWYTINIGHTNTLMSDWLYQMSKDEENVCKVASPYDVYGKEFELREDVFTVFQLKFR